MNNISLMKITFDNPYLLLLIIPIIIVAFIPYLRLKPKRRHTRNKVTSLILHCVIIVLACFVLTGIEGHNTEYVDSEIIFVNDYSDSTKESQPAMDEYIHKFLDDSRNKDSKVGLVNFGYGKVQTVNLAKPSELKNKVDYQTTTIDKTGTDIEFALTQAVSMFDKETKLVKRIILLTDAMETDGDISSLASTLTQNEIRLDAIYFSPKDYNKTYESQIENLEIADGTVPFEETTIKVTFKSHSITSVRLKITDNGKSIFNSAYREISLDGSSIEQVFEYTYTFAAAGIHEVKAEIESVNNNDLLVNNNVYYAYTHLESENSILIVGQEADVKDNGSERSPIVQQVESYGYKPVVTTPSGAPTTLGELTKYKEIILMNNNMTSYNTNFVSLLKQYVHDAGGSVLTAGGENTYIDGNMKNSPMEDILPVNLAQSANNPRAFVICLDYSNSMGMYAVNGSSSYGKTDPQVRDPHLQTKDTRIKTAIAAIKEVINHSLDPYDYLGLITFGGASSNEVRDGYGGDTKIIFGLTRATQKKEMIDKIEENVVKDNNKGGTCYDSALQYAEQMLLNLPDDRIKTKTIILVNDYDASNDHVATYKSTIERCATKGISLQSLVIGTQHTSYVQEMSDVWPEKNKIYHTTNATEFSNIVKELCKAIPTKPVMSLKGEGKFEFTAGTSVAAGVDINGLPIFKYYNGGLTVKAKEYDKIHFTNEETVYDENGNPTEDTYSNVDPIYAEWEYGIGKVGSLMIDLSGRWCSEFYTNVNSLKLLKNIITGLLPKEDVDILSINVDKFLLEKEDDSVKIDDLKGNYIRRLEIQLLTANVGEGNENTEGEETPEVPAKKISMDVTISRFDYKTNKTNKVIDFKLESSTGNIFSKDFETKEPGLYRIDVIAYEDGKQVAEKSQYAAFSYSDEYDTFVEPTGKSSTLEQLCKSTFTMSDGEKINGNMIPSTAGYENTTSRLTTRIDQTINIQLPLLIIALILFVLDIAVRKFNFLWPHELYKKYVKKEDINK